MAPIKNKKNSVATNATPERVLSKKKPLKDEEKSGNATESTSKQVLSDKKRLKDKGKLNKDDESTSEQVINNEKTMEDKTDGDVKESIATPVVKKRCTWLKLDKLLDPPSGSKLSVQNSKQDKELKPTFQVQSGKGKEANPTSLIQTRKGNEANSTFQVQTGNNKKRNRTMNGEDRDDNNNNNTDFDERRVDFRFAKKKKEIVNDRNEDMEKRDEMNEKDLGGLIFMCNAKTKPDCFGYQLMGVPANKREVVMDIKPGLTLFLYDYDLKLLYGIFKASSAGGMKLEPAAFGGGFPAQVRFSVRKDCLPLPESMFKKALKNSYDERSRKFKTELTTKQVNHLIDLFRPAPLLCPHRQSLVHERDSFMPAVTCQNPLFPTEQQYRNHGLRQEIHNMLPTFAGNDASQTWVLNNKVNKQINQLPRNPASTSDPFSIGEKEYRTYGLRGPQQIQNEVSPMMRNNKIVNPYDESTTSLVNRYLALPMATEMPSETHPYYAASREPSVFNQGTHLKPENDLISSPVSRRYSFAGPF